MTSSNLMIGSTTLSSIHLVLSLVLFTVLLLNPNIITPKYIEIFIYVSIIVNLGVFIFCYRCKNSGNTESPEHHKLMNTCIILSTLHIILSLLMLNYVTSNNIIIVFLFISIVVNSLIIDTSNKCKNLEG